jgi:hypothetical protein
MKTVCAIVSVVLVMHLQCGGLCLADSLKSSAKEQPCHQHSNALSKERPHSDDTRSRCGEGSVIAAKIAFPAKHMLTVMAAVVPVLTRFVSSNETYHSGFQAEKPPDSSSPQTRTILRI